MVVPCKIPRECNTLNYYKNQRCDACTYKEEICQCVSKKYYTICIKRKRKYRDYEDLLPKCTTNDN